MTAEAVFTVFTSHIYVINKQTNVTRVFDMQMMTQIGHLYNMTVVVIVVVYSSSVINSRHQIYEYMLFYLSIFIIVSIMMAFCTI